jgi:hypothetical protein
VMFLIPLVRHLPSQRCGWDAQGLGSPRSRPDDGIRLASPTILNSNRVFGWLGEMDSLRRGTGTAS